MSVTSTPHTTPADKSTTSSPDHAIDTAVQFLAAADESVSSYLAQFHGGDVLATATKSNAILVAEVMRAAVAIHLQTGKRRKPG